jgi:hypothetical protein
MLIFFANSNTVIDSLAASKNRRMIKRLSLVVCILVLSIILMPACKKSTEADGLAWQEKYSGDYLFTTIYHTETYQTDDTIIYNGKIIVQNEITHLITIFYTKDLTLSPNVSDDGILYLQNLGSHSGFTGQFDENGNVEFHFFSFWQSWDVTGKKL